MEEPTVVDRLDPLTWRTEEPVKFVPLAVSVNVALPVSTVVGLMLPRVGAGNCVDVGAGVGAGAGAGAVTLSVTPLDAQKPLPHTPGFVSCRTSAPALARSVACMATVNCVAETKVVARAWPLTVAVAPLTNPVPLMVRGKAALPAVTLAGLRLVMLGVGLTLGAGLELGALVGGVLTVKLKMAEVPPPGAGVKMEILREPAAARSPAGMLAES